MGNDNWQCILMLRTNVDEMNIDAIDVGNKLGQGVQFCFHLAPVIVGLPIVRQLLHRRELHALCSIIHEFFFRPLGILDPAPQIDKFLLRYVHFKRTNGVRISGSATLCIRCRSLHRHGSRHHGACDKGLALFHC
jgi:hypothetical protein